MIYRMVPFPVTLTYISNFHCHEVIIDALAVLSAQLTRDLLAIAKFLFIQSPADFHDTWRNDGIQTVTFRRYFDRAFWRHRIRVRVKKVRRTDGRTDIFQQHSPRCRPIAPECSVGIATIAIATQSQQANPQHFGIDPA